MEEQDYQYPIDAWLQDFEMELGNLGEHEKRIDFCHAVLNMLDWTFDDGSNFRSAIGEELYAAGKTEEGEVWFRNWLQREPHNENAWNVFSWCVQEREGAEAAYRLIRKEVIGVPCTIHNNMGELGAKQMIFQEYKKKFPRHSSFQAEMRSYFGV